MGTKGLAGRTEGHSWRRQAAGRVEHVQTTEQTQRRTTARYFLVRYERCSKCQQALTVEVVVDPLTHHYQIQPGTCRHCSKTR